MIRQLAHLGFHTDRAEQMVAFYRSVLEPLEYTPPSQQLRRQA